MTDQEIINAIAVIAAKSVKFKIGKTGQKVAGRWDTDYKENYNSITAICQSDSKATIDSVEERMIQHFMADLNYKNKLQNEQVGGGEMTDSTVYVVYVVH